MIAEFRAAASRFGANHPHLLVGNKGKEQSHGVTTAAHTGHEHVRQPAFLLQDLSADLASTQRSLIGQATAGVVIGAAASGALMVMGFMTLIAVLPVALVGIGSVYGARSAMERSLERTQIALEQVLDRLERRNTDSRPPSLLQLIDSALPRLR